MAGDTAREIGVALLLSLSLLLLFVVVVVVVVVVVEVGIAGGDAARERWESMISRNGGRVHHSALLLALLVAEVLQGSDANLFGWGFVSCCVPAFVSYRVPPLRRLASPRCCSPASPPPPLLAVAHVLLFLATLLRDNEKPVCTRVVAPKKV